MKFLSVEQCDGVAVVRLNRGTTNALSLELVENLARALRDKATDPAVRGLVLWAAYPAGSDDLSGYQLATGSIYGTRDGLATLDEIDASRPLLPPDTQWTAIQGGNHAQFGWYGPQSGDNEATISREEQQAQIVEATLQLLRQLGE